jgi:ComF family protein
LVFRFVLMRLSCSAGQTFFYLSGVYYLGVFQSYALMENFKNWLDAFFCLLYPNLCLACGKSLPVKQNHICINCQYKLPETAFYKHRENAFTERFWGRIDLVSAASLYHFSKGGRVQQLIHHLKYEGKKEIGIRLGQLYGFQLNSTELFSDIDMIVPVPLHPKKKHFRGYNQSAMFAKGLSESMKKPWRNALKRVAHSTTQTQKGRMERFENVENAFSVNDPQSLAGKHILLVDDVITTGATLEACALKLLAISEVKISMATIAIAI